MKRVITYSAAVVSLSVAGLVYLLAGSDDTPAEAPQEVSADRTPPTAATDESLVVTIGEDVFRDAGSTESELVPLEASNEQQALYDDLTAAGDTGAMFDAVFEVEDPYVRAEVVRTLFRTMLVDGEETGMYERMLTLLQSGIGVEEVVGSVDFLSFADMEGLYQETRSILEEDQRRYFLEKYVTSATVNLYDDFPEDIRQEVQSFGIEPNSDALYVGIIDFGDSDSYYLDDPTFFDKLSQPPNVTAPRDLVTWYLAFTTVYGDSDLRVEVDERLKSDERLAWLPSLADNELRRLHEERMLAEAL